MAGRIPAEPQIRRFRTDKGKNVLVRATAETPVSWYFDSHASTHLEHRWLGGRARLWDYQRTRRVLLRELRPAPGDRVLDIGCGPGTWSREIAATGAQVVGVDIADSMVAAAREYARGLPATFVRSDFLQAELDGQFDKIISVRAIEYFPDKGRFAEKVARHLAPGGTAVIITKTRYSIWRGRQRVANLLTGLAERIRRVKSFEGTSDAEPAFRQYMVTAREVSQAFAPYGFDAIRVRPVVLRPPVFRSGFNEIPLVPDSLAPGLLGASSLLCRVSPPLTPILSTLPGLLTESYCVTLRLQRSSR